MILSGHQPNYWPYPGLIGKIMKSDKFMYVTNVQFEKKSWQKRNRLRTKTGWCYIQVPVMVKGKYYQKIRDVEIDNSVSWKEKTLKTIQLLYSKTPYFDCYFPDIERIYCKEWKYLSELDIYIMNYILKELNCKTAILYDTDYLISGNKTDLLIDMCKKANCNIYMSNVGSAAYVDISKFIINGLEHIYIDYVGTEYSQNFYGFEPHLSILDMLMNCGNDVTKKILMNNNNYKFSEINREL